MPRGLETGPVTTPKDDSLSAHSSADFYFEKPTVILPDQLPPLKDLSTDFAYLLDGHNNSKTRRDLAIDYASFLKDRFTPGEYSSPSFDYAHRQVSSRLFIDMLLLTAYRQRYQSVSSKGDSRQLPETLTNLFDLIQAKTDLQQDIRDYVELNPSSSSWTLYGNLSSLVHHTRRVLYGDQVTPEEARRKNLAQLSGILAEYKVLSALLEKWPQANFGSAESDAKGTDIVVPSTKRPQRGAVLQVKSSRSPSCQFDILDQHIGVPIVVVPMDPKQHDPLKLNTEHSNRIQTYVLNSPKYLLAA